MVPTRAFVVSLDSTREVDLAGRRIRRLDGVRPPTEREGDRRWRPFARLTPDPARLGVPLTIVWSEDIRTGLIRATRTSPTVGVFLEDPTAGPFAWTGDSDAAEAMPGTVLVDGASVHTATAMVAHTICALATVGTAFQGFAAPEPVFSIQRGVEVDAVLTVGGHPVASGPHDAVELLYDALRNLPPPAGHFGGAVVAASIPGVASWSAQPIAALPGPLLRDPLRACGLTDAEIDAQADLTAVARAGGEAEELLGSWGAVGRWLRCPHRALGTRTPLAVLAEGGDVGPALADPYSGGAPPAPTWEPEALACWQAADAAGWDSVELRRDRHDGRWRVAGSYRGVRVVVADGLYGVTGRAEADGGPSGDVVLARPVDPAKAPAQLAACVDRGVRHPGR